MENLVPYVVSRLSTANESPLPLRKLVFAEDLVVCGFCGDGMAIVSLWSPTKSWHNTVEWPLTEPNDEIVGLHYDSIDSKAVVALRSGDFVEVSNGNASVVGSLEDGEMLCCEWSPGGDLALVIYSTLRAYILSTDFDLGEEVVIGKHELSLDDHKLAESHVSVGWGKRETQFQGRGARANTSRDPTAQVVTESRVPDGKYASPTASWRADGSVVAVNAVVNGEVALRIFTAEAHLESVSEPANHMLGLVAYEPRGVLIATIRTDGYIQFFERNGLKRYTVPIERASEVLNLAWSSDSSVLSVVYPDRVDLWTQKNWHWYRKQTIEGSFANVCWHQELSKTMGLATADEIQFFTWQFSTASDEGLVAVIDTNEIKVTPLAVAGIPPPMAFATMQFDSQPSAVAVRAANNNTVAVALPQEVHLLTLDTDTAALKTIAKHALSDVRLLTFSGADDSLIAYLPLTNEIVDVITGAPVAHPEAAVSVLKQNHYLSGSKLFEIGSGRLVNEFSEPCTDFVATPTESFGLSRSGKLLHSSGSVLAHGVTSLLAGPDHVLYTTLTTLNFVHYNAAETAAAAAAPASNDRGEQSREIERGSRLVSLMNSQMAVVLQAPRGNIETIYPRMLVLGVVRLSVAEMNYSAAFKACKVHRIDMNVLYDLNPDQFKANLVHFIAELGSDANIDLFLSSLSDEDVTRTKYIDTKSTAVYNPPNGEVVSPSAASAASVIPGKANTVLDLMRPHLSPACQITSLAMKQPAALVEALDLASKSPDLVKHLVFLSDADMLYRTALGSYEPRLALVVAQQAQMDPKEYLPFLRARDAESEHRSKFNIDVFLKRMDLAVEHLIADSGSSDDEITEFVLKHGLHAKAIKLLRQPSHAEHRAQSLREILLSQAEQWLAQSRYVDAGTNFELLGEVARACNAYIQGCNWRRALALPLNSAELTKKEVALRLVDSCEANKLYGDCAHLLLHYLEDPRRAVEMFCLGNEFDNAVLVAAASSHHPDLQEVLENQLRESFGQFQELLADFNTQVPAQLRRLRAIRAKRQEDMLGFDKLAEQMDATGLDDTLSLAGTEASGTTNASAYTRYTDKSSVGTAATNATRRTLKNQRRQDRKKARGKKGSVYEEDYLIASTSRLVDRLQSTRAELQELVTALYRRDLAVYAVQLTNAYEQVLTLLSEHLEEIFSVDDEALIRFDESGHEYLAPKPVKPSLPSSLDG